MKKLRKGERISKLTFGQARVRGINKNRWLRAIKISKSLKISKRTGTTAKQRREILKNYGQEALERFLKIKQQRFSVAVNFPNHSEYWGVLGQIWRIKITQEDKEFIIQKTQETLINFLNYDINDLWFDLQSATMGEGVQEAPINMQNGFWEIRIENNDGGTIFLEDGFN